MLYIALIFILLAVLNAVLLIIRIISAIMGKGEKNKIGINGGLSILFVAIAVLLAIYDTERKLQIQSDNYHNNQSDSYKETDYTVMDGLISDTYKGNGYSLIISDSNVELNIARNDTYIDDEHLAAEFIYSHFDSILSYRSYLMESYKSWKFTFKNGNVKTYSAQVDISNSEAPNEITIKNEVSNKDTVIRPSDVANFRERKEMEYIESFRTGITYKDSMDLGSFIETTKISFIGRVMQVFVQDGSNYILLVVDNNTDQVAMINFEDYQLYDSFKLNDTIEVLGNYSKYGSYYGPSNKKIDYIEIKSEYIFPVK